MSLISTAIIDTPNEHQPTTDCPLLEVKGNKQKCISMPLSYISYKLSYLNIYNFLLNSIYLLQLPKMRTYRLEEITQWLETVSHNSIIFLWTIYSTLSKVSSFTSF